MDGLEPGLRALLEQHAGTFSVLASGKIRCEINGHTLPPRLDAVSSFVNGAKFQKLLRRHQANNALAKYEPFIVQSKNFPLMLYCALTGQLMDKSVEAVKQHMAGKRFARAKVRFTNDELELKPEPTLESFGVRLPKSAEQQGGEQQQQQQQPAGAGRKKPAAAAANGQQPDDGGDEPGQGEGSDGQPGYWVPDAEAGGSGSGEDEAEEGGSSELGGDAMDADEEAPGPSGGDSEAMDEDADPAAAAPAPVAAAAGKQKKQKQQQAVPAAAGGGGAKASRGKPAKVAKADKPGAGGGKKQNANRPRPAKKAKR